MLKQWHQVCKDSFYAWHFWPVVPKAEKVIIAFLLPFPSILVELFLCHGTGGLWRPSCSDGVCDFFQTTLRQEIGKTRDQNVIWCVKFCGKVGRPAPDPKLFAVCFGFDFKACLKSSRRKMHLSRNSSVLNKLKKLGIPHSTFHAPSVKSVGTEQ